jgi:hypothetical protein
MLYLLLVVLLFQFIFFIIYYKSLATAKKKEKSAEIFMNNLHQWVASNDRSVLQNLDKINELLHSLYIRTRMIDLQMRNRANTAGPDSTDLESLLGKENRDGSLLNEATHKEAVEKIRSEDIHYYYATLIEELQHLNKQISRGGPRAESIPGRGNMPGTRNEHTGPVNGWYNRVNRVG